MACRNVTVCFPYGTVWKRSTVRIYHIYQRLTLAEGYLPLFLYEASSTQKNQTYFEKMADCDYSDSDATGLAVSACEPTPASSSGAANSDRLRPALFAR